MASLVVLWTVLHLCAVGTALRVELQLNETMHLNASRDDPVTLTLLLNSDLQVHELGLGMGKGREGGEKGLREGERVEKGGGRELRVWTYSEAIRLRAGARHLQLHSLPAPQVVRLYTRSEGATSPHPLLVTVRQVRGISSWQLPYVESGSVSCNYMSWQYGCSLLGSLLSSSIG